MATHPSILDCVSDLIGPDVLLLATHFFCKYGPQEKFVAWHQDVTYWGLEPAEAITAWVAIDNSDRENGCMSVIPESHHDGIREHGKSDQAGNLLSINQEASVTQEDEKRAFDLILKAGEMSLHTDALVHGSHANDSDRMRCGMTLRIGTPDVSVDLAEWPLFHWIQLRGNDPGSNNPRLEVPRGDRVPTGYNQFGQEV